MPSPVGIFFIHETFSAIYSVFFHRHEVIYRLPVLRFLDSQRVTLAERSAAKQMGTFMNELHSNLKDSTPEDGGEQAHRFADGTTALPASRAKEGKHGGM